MGLCAIEISLLITTPVPTVSFNKLLAVVVSLRNQFVGKNSPFDQSEHSTASYSYMLLIAPLVLMVECEQNNKIKIRHMN